MNTWAFQLRRAILPFLYKVGYFFGINTDAVTVLCYHSLSDHHDRFAVSVDMFEKEMEKIAAYATFISLDDAVDVFMGVKKLKLPAVAITIDDGYGDAEAILSLTKRLGIPVTYFVLSALEKKGKMNDIPLANWESVRRLRAAGWTIGCHSATHPNFHAISDEQLFAEIVIAKEKIEEELGEPIRYFAYPGGRFSERSIALVQQAGFQAAFSILEGSINEGRAKRFLLPRTIIDQTHQLSEFPAVHSQTTYFLRRLINPLGLWKVLLKYE